MSESNQRPQKRLKIVFLIESTRIGGAQRSLAILAKNLDPRLFETVVICPEKGPFIEDLRELDIHVIPMDISYFSRRHRPFNYVVSLLKLYRVIKEMKADIIHCNSINAAHWGIPLGYILPIRTICHVRDFNCTIFSSFILKYFINKIEFIAISESVKRFLNSKGVINEKITVIYNGVDTKTYHPNILTRNFEREFHTIKTQLKIGMIGRIEGWKRHIDLIEAVGILTGRIDLQLFIVGEVSHKKDISVWKALQSRISELGLENKVTFTGFRKDIPEIMAGLDIIVVPSDNEPFGRVTVEAMSVGKPVIGTNAGGTPEIIQDGINGTLVPIKNPEAIAEAIVKITSNKEFSKNLCLNARKRIIELFSIENHVKRVQDLYIKARS